MQNLSNNLLFVFLEILCLKKKGPALGYLLGSFMLSRWVYLDQTAPITETDPKWVRKTLLKNV